MTESIQSLETDERKRIGSLEELSVYVGSPVRYSWDAGEKWRYALIRETNVWHFMSYKYQAAVRGIATCEQISPDGVHVRGAILEPDFDNPDFVLMPALPEEVADARFSGLA